MGRTLAVIGCGNMGEAIVRGLLETGAASEDDIIATNPRAERVQEIQARLGIRAGTDNHAAIQEADVILLGVKPQVIKEALQEIRDDVRTDQLVISIAAGISTRFIEYYTDDAPVVRSMPNLAVTVGLGATAISAGTHATQEHLDEARAIFEAVGTVEEVPERLLDAVTGLSGTGPLYVFTMIEALSDAGVKAGLARDVATRLAVQTVRGSAALAHESDRHPATLRDRVASPGGTAITALHVLRRHGFESILMDAVEAATKRSGELGE